MIYKTNITMKKNYIAPETSVLEVEVANMMALSVDIGGEGGGDVYAPRHNDWDIWGNNNVVELED